MTKTTATVDVFGDLIEVTWNGNVWVTSNGSQHAHRSDAMRVELEAHFRACGEDIADPEIAEQIDTLLGEITDGTDRPYRDEPRAGAGAGGWCTACGADWQPAQDAAGDTVCAECGAIEDQE